MKTILCYGDSNTHGANPVSGGRWPYDKRWTGIAQGILGRGCQIIEEGLGGRTTVFDDPAGGVGRSGLALLEPILNTHKPLDAVVIMLGTNDAKTRFSLSAAEIAVAAGRLADLVHAWSFGQSVKPEVLLVSPILISSHVLGSYFKMMFDASCVEKSRHFAAEFKAVAEMKKVHFFDAASVAGPSVEDGLHMDAENHRFLGEALAAHIRGIL